MARLFPTSAIVALVVGLSAIALVVGLSLTPIFYPSAPVNNIEQAESLAEQYASGATFNPKVVEVMEFSNHYYVVVQEESTGVNALELLVDRATGNVFVEPGPNMMWNNKYGHHMGGFRDSTATMPVSPQEAINAAQNWLDQNFPSAVAGETKRFYGYYTIDFSRNNQIIGMLSVNGYSGEIWYHNWHGEFMGMREYE